MASGLPSNNLLPHRQDRKSISEKYTVYEEHALLLFSRRSENSDWISQWWPMGKNIFKHK